MAETSFDAVAGSLNSKIEYRNKTITFNASGKATFSNISDLGMNSINDILIFPDQWKGGSGRSYYAVPYVDNSYMIVQGHVGWECTGAAIGAETNNVRYIVIHV